MATLSAKKDKEYRRAEFEQYAREHWGCGDQHFLRSPFSVNLYQLTSMQDRWIGWQAMMDHLNKAYEFLTKGDLPK